MLARRGGIEVTASSNTGRHLAVLDRRTTVALVVNVDPVRTGRQSADRRFDPQAAPGIHEHERSDLLALSTLRSVWEH
jgi:hypothetical protein